MPQIVRLEDQMRTHFEQPDFLYEATKVYLMLGSAGPLDRDLVKEWMKLDWGAQWPGPAATPLRDSLQRHLAALAVELRERGAQQRVARAEQRDAERKLRDDG